MSDSKFYTVLFFSVMVTFIPRVIPFFLAKYIKFPSWLTIFLRYLPLTMMTALFFQNIFEVNTQNHLLGINMKAVIAILPGLLIGYFKRSLMLVVILSVLSMAIIRYFNL